MKPRKKDIASALLVLLALLGLCAGADETPALPDTTLADAAEAADWPRVRNLLKGGAEANMRQVDGMTALHWAAWHDRMDAATLLIEHGADADASNRYGVTPLSLACQNGNPKLVRALLEAGANAKTSLPGGETVLMIAARTGRIGAVETLLDWQADVNAKDRRGQTAVMWAAAEGHADVVSLLIEHGADFQTPLRSGFTPLFFAVREGRTDAVRVLLKAGVDVNEAMRPKSGGGRAPRDGMSPLLLAVENGHFELAVDLLQAGADPNDQRSGFSPLHALTWVRKPNKGDGLDGAPPPSGSGNVTSLQFARRLVEHGADVNARLKRGRSGRGRLSHTGATAFLLAADTADVSYMRLLLELGADPAIPNADDCPPLLAAAGIGTMAPGEEAGTEDEALAAVRLLLELGADVNAVDDNGETAMHGAAYKSLPGMVHFLADHGADINVWNKKNKYGWTPLLIAQGHRVGNFKPAAATIAAIVRAMRDAGVEPPTKPAPRAPRQRNYAPQEKKPRAKQQENP